MNFKKYVFAAVLPLSLTLAVCTAHAAEPTVEPALLQRLAKTVLGCVEQPYAVNGRTGNKVFGALRSHCAQVEISQDRANVLLNGRTYTVLVKDSELSDGGDLNDLFVQFDAREDQEVQFASNVLAFGDPALSILLVTGHKADELPQVLDPSLQ